MYAAQTMRNKWYANILGEDMVGEESDEEQDSLKVSQGQWVQHWKKDEWLFLTRAAMFQSFLWLSNCDVWYCLGFVFWGLSFVIVGTERIEYCMMIIIIIIIIIIIKGKGKGLGL